MPEINPVKFESFFKNDFEKIKDKIFFLDSFGIKQKFVCENYNFWQLIRFIKEEIEVKDSRVDWFVEKAVITMIDLMKLDSVVKNDQFFADDGLSSDLSVVAAFLNQVPNSTIYELDKIKKILSGKDVDFDRRSFIFTLRQDVNHPDGRDAIFYFVNNILDKLNTESDCDWYKAMVYIILFHIAFKHFDSFAEDMQVSLLKKGLFKAVIAGAPVRDSLAQFLYDTNNMTDFLIDNKLLFDAVSSNEEKIYYQEKVLDLKTAMSDFVEKNDDVLNTSLMVKYVESLGLAVDAGPVKKALVESINIYSLIHEAKLIDHNSSQDLSESDLAFRQTEKLLLLFANRVHWPEMLEYFKEKEGNYLSVLSFLRGFSNADLNDEAAVEKLTAFGQFLRTSGFLKDNQDLIEFHESDNKFHWAEWITK